MNVWSQAATQVNHVHIKFQKKYLWLEDTKTY